MALQENIKSMRSLLVAYSGGVDSTFLLKVAKVILGNDVVAVTSRSPIYPAREIVEAIKVAKGLKVKHLIIETPELGLQEFTNNSSNRCYYCKKGLFTRLKEIAKNQGINCIADGSNLDDTGDFRPGLKALQELGIRSPLKEVGFTKPEIRDLSKEMGLPTWNKPSLACLASRVPYGECITPEKLQMIEEAESYLFGLGVRQVRVRHHGAIARIEVEGDTDFRLLSQFRDQVVYALKKIGYTYVALDLQGYRTGSMDEILD